MRIALGVQYDGSAYCGWQIQPDQATVQNTLEQAIQQFIGKKELVRVTAAGRTDTGVHALGQVVHFDADVERDPWSWIPVCTLGSICMICVSIKMSSGTTICNASKVLGLIGMFPW